MKLIESFVSNKGCYKKYRKWFFVKVYKLYPKNKGFVSYEINKKEYERQRRLNIVRYGKLQRPYIKE